MAVSVRPSRSGRQVALRHGEIDAHHRDVVQGDDRRARADQGARRDVGQADDARRTARGSPGPAAGRWRRPRRRGPMSQAASYWSSRGAATPALLGQGLAAVVGALGLDQLGLGLGDAGVLLGRPSVRPAPAPLGTAWPSLKCTAVISSAVLAAVRVTDWRPLATPRTSTRSVKVRGWTTTTDTGVARPPPPGPSLPRRLAAKGQFQSADHNISKT